MACAKRPGWDLFESGLRGYTIQRDDTEALFPTDAQAAVHVNRCKDCRAALVTLVRKQADDIATDLINRAILED